MTLEVALSDITSGKNTKKIPTRPKSDPMMVRPSTRRRRNNAPLRIFMIVMVEKITANNPLASHSAAR